MSKTNQKEATVKIGYARVSTQEQVSGAKAARPELDRALEQLRAGDTLVVWKLDRLGRSLPHLIDEVTTLMAKGVGLKSLQDPIDTTRGNRTIGAYVMNGICTDCTVTPGCGVCEDLKTMLHPCAPGGRGSFSFSLLKTSSIPVTGNQSIKSLSSAACSVFWMPRSCIHVACKRRLRGRARIAFR